MLPSLTYAEAVEDNLARVHCTFKLTQKLNAERDCIRTSVSVNKAEKATDRARIPIAQSNTSKR